MDQRSIAILTKLAESGSYISVQDLASLFNVSRRTIYNELDKINMWLSDHDFSEIKQVYSKGLYIEKDTKQHALTKLRPSNIPYYEFSPTERKAWIYIYLTSQEKSFLLSDIIDLCRVSRNTALEDIKKLKEELNEYQITLSSERKRGYIVTGNESDIRRALIDYVALVIPENGWYGLVAELEEDLESERSSIYAIFKSKELRLLNLLIREYETEEKLEFTDNVLDTLVIWFYFFLNRMRQNQFVMIDPDEKEAIRATSEYQGARDLGNRLEDEVHIEIPVDEVCYFAKYLLSSKVNQNLSLQYQNKEMKSLKLVVKKMIQDFQIYAAVAFPDPEHMYQNILLHIKPAYYRIKYGITIENTLLDSVKRNYPEVFHLTKKVIHHLEDVIGKTVPENELAFIAMHFGGWLRSEGVVIESQRKQMLIVCTNGLGTSRLLESQMEGLFTDVDVVGVKSFREYEKMNLSVDFIISTIPLSDRGVPVFVVSPVLNNTEKEQLLKKVNSLFQSSSNSRNNSVDTVMGLIERYATVRDKENLQQELRQYFQAPVTLEDERLKPSLSDLLGADRIVFQKRGEDWKTAIKTAAQPLLTEGYIQGNYISKMIDIVKESGPYIVISNLIALPHATGDDGVNKTGMSMLHLEEPVDVMGKEAQIFIVLAPKDNEQHLKALAQLTKLFSNKSYKEEILQATTREQITNLIRIHSDE